ncbi:MAG: hypothetical protein IIU73_02190, partial [Selenomonadales bacterium]|nr:hypothetical protein [Selenomonadales bacterium]
MLFRCMMILFLLMISVMPVWACENTILPTEMTAEQMMMEDALSKVTIKAEDWLDGDMYYTLNGVIDQSYAQSEDYARLCDGYATWTMLYADLTKD